MYDLDMYTYWKKPFSIQRRFSIHPLDEPGKRKYISKESHVHHFLKKTDPFIVSSILGTNYENIVKAQEKNIKELEQTRQKNLNLTKNQNTKTFEEEKNPIPFHVTNYQNEKYHNSNITLNKTTDKDYLNNTKNNKLTIENPYTLENNLNRTSTGFRLYRKPKNFYETYGYDNFPYLKNRKEKVLYDIQNLKNYSLNVPISKNKKISSSVNLRDENLRLKENLLNQTSNKFLTSHKLPSITQIANMTQRIRRFPVGYSKEMGERYNPYALIPPSKGLIGRNYVGDKFKH